MYEGRETWEGGMEIHVYAMVNGEGETWEGGMEIYVMQGGWTEGGRFGRVGERWREGTTYMGGWVDGGRGCGRGVWGDIQGRVRV